MGIHLRVAVHCTAPAGGGRRGVVREADESEHPASRVRGSEDMAFQTPAPFFLARIRPQPIGMVVQLAVADLAQRRSNAFVTQSGTICYNLPESSGVIIRRMLGGLQKRPSIPSLQ